MRRRASHVTQPGPLPAPSPGTVIDIWLWLHHAAAPLVYRSAWVDPTGSPLPTPATGGTQ